METQPDTAQPEKDLAATLAVYIPYARQIGQRLAAIRARHKNTSAGGSK